MPCCPPPLPSDAHLHSAPSYAHLHSAPYVDDVVQALKDAARPGDVLLVGTAAFKYKCRGWANLDDYIDFLFGETTWGFATKGPDCKPMACPHKDHT